MDIYLRSLKTAWKTVDLICSLFLIFLCQSEACNVVGSELIIFESNHKLNAYDLYIFLKKMMAILKIPLKRFKHSAEVIVQRYRDRGNGSYATITKIIFSFIYANLHQTINAKLSNLGSAQNSDFLIATYDPRISKLSINSKIRIDRQNYFINGVSTDDSNLTTLYEITLSKTKANSVGED